MLMQAMIEGKPEFGFSLLEHGPLPDDLQHALTATGLIDLYDETCGDDGWINVGNSRTLYVFLSYARIRFGLPLEFSYFTQLEKRIGDAPAITEDMMENLTYADWLSFHNDTSQYASAALLFGDITATDVLEYHAAEDTAVPSKIGLTMRCLTEWSNSRAHKTFPNVWKDRTLLKQAFHFVNVQQHCTSRWRPQTSEDYCSGVLWGFMDPHEGARAHPSVRHHESDRERETAEVLRIAASFDDPSEFPVFTFDDHRMITATSMAYCLDESFFDHHEQVAKAWPRYWDFYHRYNRNVRGSL